eukprot:scaffold29871_cov121-Isochrysis_galbana.AAC.3
MEMEKTADATLRPVPSVGHGSARRPRDVFATVHAAGSSLLGLFSSCTTFDSTGEIAQLFLPHKHPHAPRTLSLCIAKRSRAAR